MILVHGNDKPVVIGDTVIDFRGTPAVVTGWLEPLHSGSTGRVIVKTERGEMAYYPSVFGLRWKE